MTKSEGGSMTAGYCFRVKCPSKDIKVIGLIKEGLGLSKMYEVRQDILLYRGIIHATFCWDVIILTTSQQEGGIGGEVIRHLCCWFVNAFIPTYR